MMHCFIISDEKSNDNKFFTIFFSLLLKIFSHVSGFSEYLCLVTSNNYNISTNLHTLNITTVNTKSSPAVA